MRLPIYTSKQHKAKGSDRGLTGSEEVVYEVSFSVCLPVYIFEDAGVGAEDAQPSSNQTARAANDNHLQSPFLATNARSKRIVTLLPLVLVLVFVV